MDHILNPLRPNNRQSKEDNSLNSIKKIYTRSNLLKCYFKLHQHPVSNQNYIREKKIILINKYLKAAVAAATAVYFIPKTVNVRHLEVCLFHSKNQVLCEYICNKSDYKWSKSNKN